MKYFIKYLVAAIATISIASCAKTETEAPVSHETHFALKATSPETKTGILYDQGTYIPYFQKGDEIGLFVNSLPTPTENIDMVYDAAFANTEDDGEEALFEGTLDVAAGDVTFYSFYPASAGKKVYVSNETVTFGLDVPSTQHPAYDTNYGYTFDPKADILIAKPATATVDDKHAAMNTVDMYFARLSAVLRLCVNAVDDQSDVYGERIKSVKIETTNGDIAGRIVVNPLTGEVTKVNNTGTSKWIEAIIDDPDVCATYIGYEGSNNVFLGVAPVSISTGSKVTFMINTVDDQGKASHKIVKTVSNLSSAIVFESSKPTVINLTVQNSEISDADEEDTTNYAGEWVIAGTDTKDYVLSKYVSGNFYPASEALSIDNDIVKVNGSKADYKVTITKVTSGTYAGMYTIKDAGDKYLTAYSTGSNYLKGVAESDLSVGSYWNISATSGELTIIASKFDGRNEIRVNHNSGNSPRFSCYDGNSSNLPKVGLYPYASVVESLAPAATPVISCENNTISITCDTEGASIYYELGTTAQNTNDPTDQSTLYDSSNKPVITADAYIKAVAIAAGYENSEIAEQALKYEDPNKIYYVKVMEAPTDWSGEYLLICENQNKALAEFSTSSTVYGIGETVSPSSGKIESTSTVDAYKITVAPASGNNVTGYTLKLNGAYVNWSAGNSLSSANAESDNTRWTISAGATSGNWIIANVATSARQIWYNTGSPRFACYTDKTENSSGYAPIQLYKYTDGKTDAGVSVNHSGSITYAPDATVQLTVTNPNNVDLSFTSSSELVATVNNSGVVTIKGAGEATITASWEDKKVGDITYRGGSCEYNLSIAKATPVITAFADSDVELEVGSSITKTTTIEPSSLAIVYTTSDKTVASIEASTGAVTGLKDGTVTISATFAGSANYNAAETKTYSLKVGTGESGITAVPHQTITFSSLGYSNQEAVSTISGTSNCSIVFAKGNGSNSPTYYTSGTAIRAYAKNTVTITANTGYKITSISFTFGSSDGSNAISASTGTYANGSWTGTIENGESVVFTIGGTNGNRRFSAISIN